MSSIRPAASSSFAAALDIDGSALFLLTCSHRPHHHQSPLNLSCRVKPQGHKCAMSETQQAILQQGRQRRSCILSGPSHQRGMHGEYCPVSTF